MHLWMESEVQLNPSISCNYYYICWVATMFTWLYSSLCLKSPHRQRGNISYDDLYGSVAKQTCPNGDPTGLFGHIVVVSPGELNVFFHRLGPRGSEAYQGFCTWDLYPFIPRHTMTGMLLLYRLISVDGSYKFHKTKKPFLLIWLFPAMALSDYVETAIPCYGAIIFPEELDRKLVRMASLGNQGKWVFTALISLVVVYLSLCARQSKKSSWKKWCTMKKTLRRMDISFRGV